MKFVRAFAYFSQFRIEVKHKFEKFNIISNALNRLPIKGKSTLNNLNVNVEKMNNDKTYFERFLNNSEKTYLSKINLLIQISKGIYYIKKKESCAYHSFPKRTSLKKHMTRTCIMVIADVTKD